MTAVDDRMIHHAASRGLVRLTDGREAALVGWKPRGNQARVCFDTGRSLTVNKSVIVEPLDVTGRKT